MTVHFYMLVRHQQIHIATHFWHVPLFCRKYKWVSKVYASFIPQILVGGGETAYLCIENKKKR